MPMLQVEIEQALEVVYQAMQQDQLPPILIVPVPQKLTHLTIRQWSQVTEILCQALKEREEHPLQ